MAPARHIHASVPALLIAGLVVLPAPAWPDSDLAGIAAPAADNRADCTAAPGPLFDSFFRRLVAIDKGPGSEPARRIALFRAFNTMFTTRPLAEAALGRYWTLADEKIRQRYLELFHFHFMENYLGTAIQASRYWLDDMVVRPLDGGGAVIVLDAPRMSDPVFRNLEIHVAPAPCGLALLDVRASGWSLAELMRAEFRSIARQGGLSALIARLEDRAHTSPIWMIWQARSR